MVKLQVLSSLEPLDYIVVSFLPGISEVIFFYCWNFQIFSHSSPGYRKKLVLFSDARIFLNYIITQTCVSGVIISRSAPTFSWCRLAWGGSLRVGFWNLAYIRWPQCCLCYLVYSHYSHLHSLSSS